MIPANTVQEIIDAARIEEVVEEYVSLRKRGSNYIGLCPFHNEKTPSFTVNPAKNIFKCFGCGKGGDSVGFLMEHEQFKYPEALRWLAKKYNIEIEEQERTPEQLAAQQLNDSLYIVNDFALKHFQEQLFETDEGKSIALSYFKQRGLREDTIRHFGLGYAPNQWDLLVKRAEASGYSKDLLRQLGLSNQEGTRDFFRDRVMFTIHNLSGKVAAFAGRTMSTDKKIPKYINSPETAVYVKNKILYGAFQARKSIRQKDECILVEGYMDVISLYQAGVENVVASSGTSLTEGQLQLIKRNTSNLKILYDGDPAGIKAALRGLDLALEQDLNVRIALLPEGEDPDSYVQKVGTEAFLEYMDRESKDFILFKTNLLLAETQGDPIKKAGLIKDIVGSISKVPDPIKRSVYLKECSALLEVSEPALVAESNKLIGKTLRKQAEKEAREPGSASDTGRSAPNPEMLVPDPEWEKPEKPISRDDAFQERDIVRLLVQFGDRKMEDGTPVAQLILSDIEDLIEAFDAQLYARVVRDCYQRLLDGKLPDKDFFMSHESKAVSNLAVDLLTSPWDMSPNWEEKWGYPLQNQPMPDLNIDADMHYVVDMFKLRKLKKMCDVINPARIKEAFAAGEDEKAMNYMRVQVKIQEVRNEIARRRNLTVLP
jgi:DNA primase